MEDMRIPRRSEEALAQGLEWTAREPLSAKAWSRLSFGHEIQGQFKQALKAARKAAELDPSPAYFFKWGRIAHRDGDYPGAAEAFGRCAEGSLAESDHFYLNSARVAQAHCLALAGQSAHATRLLDEAGAGGAVWLGGHVDRQSVLTFIQG